MSFSAFSQSDNASISGFVKDASGAVVPGAKITIKNEGVAIERIATTNNDGYYAEAALPPGLYTVEAEHAGFQKFQVLHKILDPSIATTVDIALQVGSTTESVTVTASTAAVQSETATLGGLVNQQTIDLSALDGRNPLFLAGLMPGVIGGLINSNSYGLTTGSFAINGARPENSMIYFDGAIGVRTRGNTTWSIGTADIDSTQEVQVLTSNYDAEYGRQGGGEIRIVSKSGTSQFHGVLYEYFRNPVLNADTWSRNDTGFTAPSPFRYNQFGFLLNGPIILPGTNFNRARNKLFFSWGEEWVRQRSDSLSTAMVPDALMRQGNFSEFLTPSIWYSTAKILKDPNGNPYPNNTIPANQLSPNGMALITALPAPIPGFLNASNQNWFFDFHTFVNQRKDTPSFDWNITDKQQLRIRGQMFISDQLNPTTTYASYTYHLPDKRISVNYVYTISPTWINEILGVASKDHVTSNLYQTPEGSYARSAYGFNFPYLFPTGKDDPDKIPTDSWPNSPFLTLNGEPYPSHSAGPVWQLSDNVTHIFRNHTFKFGAEYEKSGENDADQIVIGSTPGGTNNQNGDFTFADTTPGGTGLAFANAAVGKFSTYAEVGPRDFTPYRSSDYELYAQDSWKVTSKLRVEIGMRWEIIRPYHSLWGNIAYFDPSLYNPSIAVTINPATGNLSGSPTLQQQYNGMVIPGTGWPSATAGRVAAQNSGLYNFLFSGGPNYYTQAHLRDISPRLGLAYAFDPKTVIRAGFGRFFDRTGVSDGLFPGGNPPVQLQASVANGNVDNPGGVSATLFPLYVFTYDKKNPTPESFQWNATFQREIGFGTVVSVGYVGRHGVHLPLERNIDQLPLGTCPQSVCPKINGVTQPIAALVPYLGFSEVLENANIATSMYNALQAQATHRVGHGVTFNFAYTYSKSDDIESNYESVLPNAWDDSMLWGPSTFDRRNVVQSSGDYALPFLKNNELSGKLLGGWHTSGIFIYESGTPLSVSTSTDYAGVGTGGGSQFWVVNGPLQITDQFSQGSSAADPNFYFQPKTAAGTAEFTAPSNGTFNTQRVRDFFTGPGQWNANLALFKEFRITERQKVTLRWETYNTLNHPNWSSPSTSPTSASLGKITSKSGNRDMQIALRYSF